MFENFLKKFADITAWISVGVLLSGGVVLRHSLFGKAEIVEFNQWGLLLLPAFLCVFFNLNGWRDLNFIRSLKNVWDRCSPDVVLKLVIILIPFLHFLALVHRHYSFHSNWDLAIYSNACANSLHSSLRNHTTLMADHIEPILGLLTPLCSNLNPAITLLATQCCAWSIGAFGVYKISLSLQHSKLLSSLFAFLYLTFSGHQTISYLDFHTYGLSLATIPWILFGYRQNSKILIVAVVVHLAIKENTGLFIAGLGLFALTEKRFKVGGSLFIVGLSVFAICMLILYPYFRNGQESEYFSKYYGHLGHNFKEFAVNIFLKPKVVFETLISLEKTIYLFKIFTPFLFIPLFRPKYLLPIGGPLAISILSNVPYMYSTDFHYEAEIYPWLFVSTIVLLGEENWNSSHLLHFLPRLINNKIRVPFNRVWVFVSWIIIFFTGAMPQSRISYYMPSRANLELAAALQQLEHDYHHCNISTLAQLAPHLSRNQNLTLLSDLSISNMVVVAFPRRSQGWDFDAEKMKLELYPLLDQKFSEKIFPLPHDQSFQVWTNDSCKQSPKKS
ncbi:MAG: DUF2079 domain-containing protein [Proteobacteria bacterium]|nr:DUF2079 domain-containing protein [Pseudomonadota bacterium]